MHRTRLVTGLAAGFGLMTAIFVVGGVALSPALFLLALVFGGVTYVLYRHATGRLMGRVYRGVQRQAATEGADAGRGGFGAGPREEWTPPRDRKRRRRQRARRERRPTGGAPRRGPSTREAYGALGLAPGADEEAVRQAYRDRIKEVHPDTDGGDEEEFKRVREAYEVLTD